MAVRATVRRPRRRHQAVTALEQPGVGLEIEAAPDAYYQLLTEIFGRSSA
jgi:hypothetical protein